jgi:peptidoglycan/xylan/chitin deacetylase (PgdA/CDA1 family)
MEELVVNKTAVIQNNTIERFSPQSSGILQRKCTSCSSKTTAEDECAGCTNTKGKLQRKLSIGASDDPLEHEADRVADQVMSMSPNPGITKTVSRIQRASTTSGGSDIGVPASVNRVLAGSGRPMQSNLKQDMEQRFSQNFSQVRVHTGTPAEQSARDVDAHAYTVGQNIVFGAGQFSPNSVSGKKLLAHELTHVLQQNSNDFISRNSNDITGSYLQRSAIYSGRILYEGTCEHLACNSKWACEDNENGIICPDGTRNAFSETNKKFRPLFTCDTRCENNETCEDGDNWMAIPAGRFERSKCDQDLVICANGHLAHGVVRDKSSGEHWEVSPGIIDSLDLPRGTFTGSIYGDESDPQFLRDGSCRPEENNTKNDTDSDTKSNSENEKKPDDTETSPPTGTGVSRVFSLTFDDGPHAAGLGNGGNRTEKVLDTLQNKGAKGGFFIQTHALSGEGRPFRGNTAVGQQLIRRMHTEGHAIGIHTGGTRDHESHPSAQVAGRLQSELETAKSFIRDTTAVDGENGVEPTLVRPPFGRSNPDVRQTYQNVGLSNLLWDIDGDPQGEMSQTALKTQVATGIHRLAANNWQVSTPSAPKIVVLYHDIRRNTSTHIGSVIDHIEQVTRNVDGSNAVFERP